MSPESRSESDEELVRHSQAGSLTAFEELVYRYERRLYAFVLNFCRQETDAEEVVQDTFVRAYQALAQYRTRHSFGSWLFTIARHQSIDRYRRTERMAGQPLPEPVDLDSPAELLARQEERNELWNLARRRLPHRQFEALWLRYAAEMNISEIAHVLRRTETHVKVLLFRARKSLARGLPAPERVPASKSAREGQAAKTAVDALEKTALLDMRLARPGWLSVNRKEWL